MAEHKIKAFKILSARADSIAVLAALIVTLGQLNAIAHAFDIDDSHPGHCVICTHIQAQGHAVDPAPLLLPSVSLNYFPVITYRAGIPPAFPHIPGSRAPPGSLI
jgi:hypothetical protein